MSLPISVLIKDLFGLYVLTPFEEQLLGALSEVLEEEGRNILRIQLNTFTTVRRLIKHKDVIGAHGFTNFYTLRFGKDISDKRQTKRFDNTDDEAVLAVAKVIHEGGVIDVKFMLVHGVLFCMDYYSPQKIYYPIGQYSIEVVPSERPAVVLNCEVGVGPW